MKLHERLTANGPKRMLSIDGGGARIIMSLGFLEEIECILRERYDRPDLRLCDYFDLIGGTSAGALVAAVLALGVEAREVVEYGLDFADKIFRRKLWRAWEARYDERPLKRILKERFGNLQLDDASIRSGLCIMAKRADTHSIWPLINHPDGKFYELNKHILLRNAIQASTAAPTFFVPVAVDVGDGERAAFVDGGASVANNPALQLFMIATLSGFPFHWPTGADQLLLTSVGTGTWEQYTPVDELLDANAWDWAEDLPMALIDEANMQSQLILQWLSRSPTAVHIDAEVGDLSGDLLAPEPLLHYLRYNVRLEADELCEMGLGDCGERVADFYALDSAEQRHDMLRIGRAAARCQITPDHFPASFDLP